VTEAAAGTSLSLGRTRVAAGKVILFAIVATIGVLLLFQPFLFPDVRSSQLAARICVFVVLAASFDLLIGYTGIVSFGHTMFFAMGAYGAAMGLKYWGPDWGPLLVGGAAGILAAAALAALIGLLSLRVKAIFFAMVTLAAGSVMLVLASQLSNITGGEDGLVYSTPRIFKPATKLLTDADGQVVRLFDVPLNGKLALYYFVFIICFLIFFALTRIVRSPLGTVLEAIRENEMRAQAIGYRVTLYRTSVFVVAAIAAAIAGIVWAVWLRYTGPATTLELDIMIDILLMVVIGGMGTMYGAVIGVVVMSLAQTYLKDVMEAASTATANLPLVPHLLAPERWPLWLGVLFILLVFFFPAGIAGTLVKKGNR
jgi:branched-chain amino acid transport system permease protein